MQGSRGPLLTNYNGLIRGNSELFVPLLVGFYETVLLGLNCNVQLARVVNDASSGRQVQAHGTNRVGVTRDDVINAVRVGVGINDRHNRDTQVVGFLDRDVLVLGIDNEQNVRQAAHVLDTAQALLQLFHFASTHQRLFLGQLVEGTVLSLGFQVFQTLDGLTNGLPVGQHTAQPAMVHIELIAAGSALSSTRTSPPSRSASFRQRSDGLVHTMSGGHGNCDHTSPASASKLGASGTSC